MGKLLIDIRTPVIDIELNSSDSLTYQVDTAISSYKLQFEAIYCNSTVEHVRIQPIFHHLAFHSIFKYIYNLIWTKYLYYYVHVIFLMTYN